MREATQPGFDKAFGVAMERHHTSFSSHEPQHKTGMKSLRSARQEGHQSGSIEG